MSTCSKRVAAAATVVTLVLGGCGGGTPAVSTSNPVVSLDPGEVIAKMQTAMDDAGSWHFDIETSADGFTERMVGDVAIDPPPRGTLRSTEKAGTFEFVFDGERAAWRQVAPRASSWTAVSREQVTAISSQVGLEPTFALFESALRQVTEHEERDVRGERQRRYSFTMDTRAAAESLDMAPLPSDVPSTFTFVMWLDDKWLIHSMSGDFGGSRLDATLSEWGKTVSVQFPSAEQLRQ